jgi:hypothetical protein
MRANMITWINCIGGVNGEGCMNHMYLLDNNVIYHVMDLTSLRNVWKNWRSIFIEVIDKQVLGESKVVHATNFNQVINYKILYLENIKISKLLKLHIRASKN